MSAAYMQDQLRLSVETGGYAKHAQQHRNFWQVWQAELVLDVCLHGMLS